MLSWSVRQVDLLTKLARIDLGYLAAAVAMMPVALTVRGVRLNELLAASGAAIGVRHATAITFIGTSLNVLLPSNLGDVAKSYYAYRHNLPKEVALSAVVIDKAFGMTGAMLVGLIAAMVEGLWAAAALAGLLVVGLAVLIFIPRLIPWRLLAWAFNKTLGRTFRHEDALAASRFPIGTKLAAIGLSLLACGLAYGQYYMVCQALALPVPMTFVLVAAPLMDLVKAVPMTANGLGTREAVAVVMLQRIGVSSGDALLSSLIFTAVSLWAPALVGAPFVWLAMRTRPQAGLHGDRGPANDGGHV